MNDAPENVKEKVRNMTDTELLETYRKMFTTVYEDDTIGVSDFSFCLLMLLATRRELIKRDIPIPRIEL